MKILHLIDSGGLYGAEKMLLSLVKEQVKQGLEPMILSAGEPEIDEKPIESEARRNGLPVKIWRMKPGLNLKESCKILKWAQKNRYDLLHSHGYKFNVLIGLWPAMVRRIPLITTLHGYIKAPRFSKSWMYEALDRIALRQMDAVVMVTHAIEKEIPQGIESSGKAFVIANGLETEQLAQCAAKALPSDLSLIVERHRPLLLAVGRLSHEKGFDRLVDAFKLVKDKYAEAGLIIIGEGGKRNSLEQQALNCGLSDAIYLPGYFESVPALMARANLLCIPSRTEGLPITLLEAMAVGLPICASDVGEINKVLGGGRGGKVSRIDGAESLGTDLLTCLADPDLLSKAADWAKARVNYDYSATQMAKNYSVVYRQTLAEIVTT